MENTNSSPNSKLKFIMPASILAIVALAAIAFYVPEEQESASPPAQPAVVTETVTETVSGAAGTRPADSEQVLELGSYQDGTYQATGRYMSPGGEREVVVSLTLAEGVVTEATFEGFATDPASKRFQGEFAEGFQVEVVGRNIDELNLQKVSGSSLTPKGFMDALQQIKVQAQG